MAATPAIVDPAPDCQHEDDGQHERYPTRGQRQVAEGEGQADKAADNAYLDGRHERAREGSRRSG